MTREECIRIVNEFDGKYPNYGIEEFVKYSGMSKLEVDQIIDSYTNPIFFKQNDDGSFQKDLSGNLIKNFQIN
jgi:hypothetical protein